MKVKLLMQRHPDQGGDRLARLRALFEGGPAWHARITEWLPRRPVEPDDIYKERRQLATYINHAGPAASMLSALLFSEAPKVSGLDGAYYDRLWTNCDRDRTSWRSFWRARLNDAQVGRRAWVWVNLPARPEDAAPETRADEESQGYLDAWLVGLEPEQVLDWGEDLATGQLAWILFYGVHSIRPSPEAPRTTIWRWTFVDRAVIRTWEWTPKKGEAEPNGEDDAEEQATVEHGLGRVPVTCLELPTELWTLSKMEDAAIAALRARNENTWALHQAANELLVITSKWGDEEPSLGHGHYLKLGRDKEGKDAAAYVGPSGVAFDHLSADVKATREDIYRVIHQMALAADSDATRARMSGESKQQDWNALTIVLEAYQELVLDAMTATAELIAQVRGDATDDVHVVGLEGWRNEDLTAFLEAAAMATDARLLSPSFRKAIARRQAERLLGDEVDEKTLQDIREEINDADLDPAPYIPPAPPTNPQPPAPKD